MDQKEEKFAREVDMNIYKLLDAYRVLLTRSVVEKSLSIHEDFESQAAAASLVRMDLISPTTC